MRRTTPTVLGLVAAASLLAACNTGGGSDPTSEPPTTASSTEAPTTEEPTSEQPTSADPTGGQDEEPEGGLPDFPTTTDDQMGDASDDQDLVLQDVRVAEHEGFDRIVLEFSGNGVPGWSIQYVDEAVVDGSGDVVTLDGDSILDVYASGTTYPQSEADYYDGPKQFQPEDGGDIDDVYVAGTFEGDTQVLVGLDGDAVPFRVFALTEPSRLVVDVVDTED